MPNIRGQKVMYNHIKNGFLNIVDPNNCSGKNHLKLKSLKLISDNEAIEVAKITDIGVNIRC